ncbi:MAG: tetratricopeptide repeat protein [Planctomycetes bacterium]|nr:tetratricopeptide repeat protein [Planctomycetota bacterium]
MASERNGASRRFFKHPRASALRLTLKLIIDRPLPWLSACTRGLLKVPRRKQSSLCILLCGFSLAAATRSLEAQLTVKQLIGDAVQQPEASQFPAVEGAIKAFFSGQVNEARQSLQKARVAHPGLPPVDAILARLWFAVGRLPEAREALEQCVASEANDPEAYIVFAELAFREGRVTDADSNFKRGQKMCEAAEQESFRYGNLRLRAAAGVTAVALRRRKWSEAERLARAWLKLDVKSSDAQSNLGRSLFFQNKYRDAYRTFQSGYELNPALPLPEINMALLYEELVQQGDQEKHDNARNAMNLAEEKDSENLITRLAIAQWALESCEIEIAKRNSDAALKLAPNSYEARMIQGLVARHQKEFLAAEKAFESAHLNVPSDPAAIAQLALSLAAQDNPRKRQTAIEYARLNSRANPDSGQRSGRDAAIVLAWSLFCAGKVNDASQLAQTTLAAGSISDENAFFAAQIQAATGQHAAARRILKPVIADSRCFPAKLAAEALWKELADKRATPP